MANYHLWQKKIGELHIFRSGEMETICGRPMLGNNYAYHRGYKTLSDIPEDVDICKECLGTYSQESGCVPKKKVPSEFFGSIALAGEIDRIKDKIVQTMNRLPHPTDQVYARQVDEKLRELETLLNVWEITNEAWEARNEG